MTPKKFNSKKILPQKLLCFLTCKKVRGIFLIIEVRVIFAVKYFLKIEIL